MELKTITMPGDTEAQQRNAARRAFLEYRQAVRERHDREDEQIMRGYKALAQGKQLIHLRDTIKAGGLDANGRPALAVMRADQHFCFYNHQTFGRRFSFTNDGDTWRARHSMRVHFGQEVLEPKNIRSAKALVPTIPPALRPNIKLRNFHILWEADWEAVPRDPALLRHLGGDLYAVVAIWDLTDLERAVLGGRL